MLPRHQIDRQVRLSRDEERPIETGSRKGEFGTEQVEAFIEKCGSEGELIAVQGDPANEQVNHTQVAGGAGRGGGGRVTDGDSSERLPSTSDKGHVNDHSYDESLGNSPDNSSVRSKGGESNELARVRGVAVTICLRTLDFSSQISRRARRAVALVVNPRGEQW